MTNHYHKNYPQKPSFNHRNHNYVKNLLHYLSQHNYQTKIQPHHYILIHIINKYLPQNY